jgi:hypothetical protein
MVSDVSRMRACSQGGTVIRLTSGSHAVFEGLEIRNGMTASVSGLAADGPVSDVIVRGCSLHDMSGPLTNLAGDPIRIEGNEMYRGAMVNVNNPPSSNAEAGRHARERSPIGPTASRPGRRTW